MAHSDVEVCNAGLIAIGAKPIMSLSDNVKTARLCKNRFEHCRDAVLRMHPWNCAIKRVVLSPLVGAPAFGFDARFQIPSDCLRVLTVSPEDDVEYRIESNEILADESSLDLKYIRQVVNSAELDEGAAESIGAYLAWKIAFSLTESATVEQIAEKNFEKTFKRAKTHDAQEDDVVVIETDTWIGARQSEPIGRSNR